MATSRNVVGQKVATANRRARPNHDFYSTPVHDIERMINKLFEEDSNVMYHPISILDPCAGNGAFKKAIANTLPCSNVTQWDIVERDEKLDWVGDFLSREPDGTKYSFIMMNPPFGQSMEFIQHAFKFLAPNGVIVAFLKLDFLASKKRYAGLFSTNNKLAQVLVNVSRVNCKYEGNKSDKQSSTTDSGWFIFQDSLQVTPTIKWLE